MAERSGGFGEKKDDIVLVILDIVMPGMDGFAFMEEARTRESIRNIPPS